VRGLLALTLVAAPGGGWAQEAAPPAPAPPTIDEIRFEGNDRTRENTMLREMLVRPGDVLDADLLEQSRQAIMDLGLFKSVETRREPGTAGEIVTVTVREKRYLFVLPALSRSGDGDWTYGAQARFDNLDGRNHRLKFSAERKKYASGSDVDDEDQLELSYSYPRIADGPWELDTTVAYRTAFLEEDRDGVVGEYDRLTRRVGLVASHWKKPAGPSRGWRFGTGVSVEDFDFELRQGAPGLFFDTTEVGLLGQVAFRHVHSYEFSKSGHESGYALDVYPEALGSAEDRVIQLAFHRAYLPVTRRVHTNFNYQLRWGWTDGSLFGDPTFSLGGSTRLRGYDRQAIEGDAFILANCEFLRPIFGKDALRAVAFLDVGDAFRDSGHFTLSDLKAGGGAGLRWRLRSFVEVDLRLDVARGFDQDAGGETKVYAGTDATF
jgi:outer membrane protein assembly factor BamA